MAVGTEAALVVDVVAWTVLGLGIGYVHHRIPARRLDHDGPLTRLRSFETNGDFYERWFRIRAWKDRLPEAGAFFAGGVSKRALVSTDTPTLVRFAQETRRAERVHASLLAVAPLFLLWNPPGLGAAMVVYAVVANVPFMAVQRFNRIRLQRVLTLRAAAAARRMIAESHPPR